MLKWLMPNLKTILFDLVGVLVFKKEKYEPKTKDEINASNIEGLFNHVDDEKLINDIKAKLKLTNTDINSAIRLIPEKYERFEKLWKILPKLKKRYKLAIINNGNAIASKYWKEKFGFEIFDLFINSTKVGTKKPDLKIYLLACKRLDVGPKECLFMDDRLENIEAANKLGMKTFWWNLERNKNDLLKTFIKHYGH